MQAGSEAIVALGPDTNGVPSYPALVLRLWLVRARLEARQAVRAVWPYASADDRRLAALVVALAMALILLIGSLVTGSSAASTVLTIAIGFFATLAACLFLLFGPADEDCQTECADVLAQLPVAKQSWQTERAKARAARASRRAERAAARQARRAERAAARAARQAASTAPPTTTVAAIRSRSLTESHIWSEFQHTHPITPEGPVPSHDAEDLVELVLAGPPVTPWLNGNGTFSVLVVGEVHLGRILEAVLGELPGVGEERIVPARLRAEDSLLEPPAVAVEIHERRVGHLSRADAQAFCEGPGRTAAVVRCRAAVHGIWEHGRIRHTVRLDLNW
jgi:hypothetical protein